MTLKRLFILLLALVIPATVVGQETKQQLNDQLYEAVRKGDAATVSALLDKGADVNAKFRYGATALFKAAERGHTDVVKLLLARGADATVRDTFYSATAMTWALSNNHIEVVKALLEKDGSSVGDVLMTGVRQGKPELVNAALGKGGLKAETLTGALATAEANKEMAAIAEMLKKAGAVPPLQLDEATLQSYVGRYKADQRADIVFSLQNGKLVATPAGQGPIMMMALDKTTLKPTAFDGLTVTFTSEADKVTGMTLKQGSNSFTYKKSE